MNAATIQRAHALLGALPPQARDLVKQGLAGRLHATGLRATLEWLETGHRAGRHDPRVEASRALASRLRGELGLAGRELRELDNIEILEALRRATALLEALHVVERATRSGA